MTLRTRLAFGLVVVAALGALVFGAAARSTVERVLLDDVDQELVQEVRRTTAAAGRPRPDRFGQRGAAGRRPGEFFGRGAIYAQVTSASGDVVQRTSAVDAIGGLPEPEKLRAGSGVQLRTVRIGDERFRLGEAATARGDVVQVARPLGELGDFLRTLLWVLVVAGAIALAAAAAFGRWAARATLRPVEAMTRTARLIADSPRDLSTRIEPAFPDEELAEFADALNGMLDSIQAADEQQRRFVADASHELRTPLTSLGGNAAYLERTAALDDEGREAVAAVRRDVDRLVRLADGLTTLARLDAAATMQLEPVAVEDVAREAIARARAAHPDHAFALEGSAGTELLDAELLRRIFGNLLDNAGRYTPRGSSVRLVLDDAPEELHIEVVDDGPGLASGERDQVLERFHRGSTAAGIAGTGLGLAIVAEAAAALGGALRLGNVDPHGLRCEVRIPRTPGTPTAPR